MPALNFNNQLIKGLKTHKRKDYYDSKITGLGLRVSPRGGKSWFISIRKQKTKRRITLGNYPIMDLASARSVAQAELLKTQLGQTLSKDLEVTEVMTCEELSSFYMERYAKPKKKSWKSDEYHLKVFNQYFAKKSIFELRRRDINHFLHKLVTKHGYTTQANRIFETTRRMFNFAIEQDLMENSPCFRVKKLIKEKSRDRVFSDGELAAFFKALENEELIYQNYYKFLFLTAQRPGEVKGMRWSELDLKSKWWTIPADRSKNGLSHRVPLSEELLQILQSQREHYPSIAFVFPSPTGSGNEIHNTEKAFTRIKKQTQIENIRPYDLRRTAATRLASNGVPRLVISKILNHKEKGITAVYERHSYDQEKVEAYKKLTINGIT